jgi:hypothetical protein
LGPQREIVDRISESSGQYEHQPFMDLGSGRGLLQRSARGAEGRAGYARAGAGRGFAAIESAAEGSNTGPDDHNRAGQPASDLCAAIQPYDRLRSPGSRLSRLFGSRPGDDRSAGVRRRHRRRRLD